MNRLARNLNLAAILIGVLSTAGLAIGAAPTTRAFPPSNPVITGGVAAFTAIGLPAGEVQRVSVEGEPFDKALRARVATKPSNPWSVQLVAKTSGDVSKGDLMLATFWLRAGGPGGAGAPQDVGVELVFERAGGPYEKSVEYDASAGEKWERFQVPFSAVNSYPAGAAQVNFRLHYAPQSLEVGGVEVVNFGKGVKPSDLPIVRKLYPGEAPDAPWRKAADERIERLRKGDLVVSVTDRAGKPLAGATVDVHMKRHAFPFGSAVASDLILEQSPQADRYRQTILDLFNQVTIENHLKWNQWQHDRETGLRSVAWLREHGIEVRGHSLVWPSARYTPREVMALKDRPDALRKAVADHITDEVSALRGQVVAWDVINEPWDNHDIQDVLGREVMVDWFKLAKAADPAPRLFINDYPPLLPLSSGDAHLAHYAQTIQFLKDHRAPLEGIGFQCHYTHNFAPPAQILQGLDDFAKFGLPIEITEFDVNAIDEQLQADAMRDMLTAAFSHPAVHGVIMWGFWAGRHWEPDAALFAKDWTLRPHGQVWIDLVTKKWWTHEKGTTDQAGTYRTRGFFGDYEITVHAAGNSKTVKATLDRTRTEPVKVALD